MFENFNKLVEENNKLREEKQSEQEQAKPKKLKPIPFWNENHKRTTSSGVRL